MSGGAGAGVDVDIVVAGAGLAGLTAARELESRGFSVDVCEAGERIGGRAFTRDTPYGPLEMGATWVHWSHPHVWSEMTRYGLEYVPDPPFERVLLSAEGEVRTIPSDEFHDRFGAALTRLFAGTRGHFESPFAARCRERLDCELDTLTISDWMERCGLDTGERALVGGYLEALSGYPNAVAGLHTFAHWWAAGAENADGFLRLFDGGRIHGGTGALARAIAGDLRSPVRMGTPLAGVERTASGVLARFADGSSVSARHLVLAAPMNTWDRIEFSPELPESIQALSERRLGGTTMGAARVAVCEGDFPRFEVLYEEGQAISSLFTFSLPEGRHVVKAYSLDWESLTAEAMQHALDEAGIPLRVRESLAMNWGGEPEFMGAWTYAPVGALRAMSLLEDERVDGVSFAGGDTSPGLSWMDGAIASGYQAARETRELLEPATVRGTV